MGNKLNLTEKLLYSELSVQIICNYSNRYLSKIIKRSKKSVNKAIKKLQHLNLIKVYLLQYLDSGKIKRAIITN